MRRVLRPAETFHIPICSCRKKAKKIVLVRMARALSGVFWLAAAHSVLQQSNSLWIRKTN